ncbi:MAG: hypothetical protein HUJ66_08655 [Oscillospiraceae bacterium]|nr:hypothetical protein [Oscillospiraceae bacterium]
MRKFFAALLTLTMILALCSCGSDDKTPEERDCGVFVTVLAKDAVFTISCGTEDGSESASNADKSVIEPGTVFHFDFAGEAAEGSEEAIFEYSICAYDENLDIVAENSFSDDFSGMAKYSIVITEDLHIIYEGQELATGGDIFVSYTNEKPIDGVTLMAASVSMSARPEAEEAVNAAVKAYNDTFSGEQYEANKAAYAQNTEGKKDVEPFSMSRTVRVMRGDAAVLSFRMADRVNLGDSSTLAINCRSFDPQTGKELGIADIAADTEKFTEFCAEKVLVATTEEERFLSENMVFVEGYTDNIRALISDGHWYLSSEGMVIAANPGDIAAGFYEFVIPYDKLEGVMKKEYLPAEQDGNYGYVSLQPAANADIASYNFVGGEPAEDCPLVLSVSGNVCSLTVYTGAYNADKGSFTADRQLFFVSDLAGGCAVAVNHAPVSGNADLMVRFTVPDGTERELTVALDASGALLVSDLTGDCQGNVVEKSFACDFNGDGSDETLKVQSGDSLTLTVGKATAVAELSDAVVRVYDLSGDGRPEIYVSGTSLSGDTLTYCYVYDGALTAKGEPLPGLVTGFNGNRVFLSGELSVLGSHAVSSSCLFSTEEDRLVLSQNAEYVFTDSPVLTASVDIALTDGSKIAAGTEVQLKSTDGQSYVRVSAGGVGGVLGIVSDGVGGWTVNGQPAGVCFNELA